VFGGLASNNFCTNDLYVIDINPKIANNFRQKEVKRLTEQTVKAFKGTLSFKRTKHIRNKFFQKKAEGKTLI
jgi:hypothetical protein